MELHIWHRPTGKVGCCSRTDGSLNAALSDWRENHGCLQDASHLCQSSQCDSWGCLWPWLPAWQLSIIPVGTMDKYFYSYTSKYIPVNKLIFHRWWNSTGAHWPSTVCWCFNFFPLLTTFALGYPPTSRGLIKSLSIHNHLHYRNDITRVRISSSDGKYNLARQGQTVIHPSD